MTSYCSAISPLELRGSRAQVLRFQPTSVPWNLIILPLLVAGSPWGFQVVSELGLPLETHLCKSKTT